MNNREISPNVIKRLPRYYRFLGELYAAGVKKISSAELSHRMGLTASQIRQDLNCFGGFGQQGYGYNTAVLRDEIGTILGFENSKKIILIGAGNLGRAIAQHLNFSEKGFSLIGIFDKKESLIGTSVKNMPIRPISDLDEFCRENHPDSAILCIPKDEVFAIAESLIKLNVKGFLNFSHYDISLNFPGVAVENIHVGDSLMRLSYDLNRLNKS